MMDRMIQRTNDVVTSRLLNGSEVWYRSGTRSSIDQSTEKPSLTSNDSFHIFCRKMSYWYSTQLWRFTCHQCAGCCANLQSHAVGRCMTLLSHEKGAEFQAFWDAHFGPLPSINDRLTRLIDEQILWQGKLCLSHQWWVSFRYPSTIFLGWSHE